MSNPGPIDIIITEKPAPVVTITEKPGDVVTITQPKPISIDINNGAVEQLVGSKGQKGAQGEKGTKGEVGPKGAEGTHGIPSCTHIV